MSTHWIHLGGRIYKVVLPADGPPEVDGKPIPTDIRIIAPGVFSLLLNLQNGATRSFRCIADTGSEQNAVLLDNQRIPYSVADPRSLRAASAAVGDSGPRPLKAPMPGRIVRVLVAAGETVAAGQGCVVIEAMKMQNELKAPKTGTVARLSAEAGATVAAGAVLLVID